MPLDTSKWDAYKSDGRILVHQGLPSGRRRAPIPDHPFDRLLMAAAVYVSWKSHYTPDMAETNGRPNYCNLRDTAHEVGVPIADLRVLLQELGEYRRR